MVVHCVGGLMVGIYLLNLPRRFCFRAVGPPRFVWIMLFLRLCRLADGAIRDRCLSCSLIMDCVGQWCRVEGCGVRFVWVKMSELKAPQTEGSALYFVRMFRHCSRSDAGARCFSVSRCMWWVLMSVVCSVLQLLAVCVFLPFPCV